MKKILILFIILFSLNVLAANTVCYQETATSSTTCGGLSTGAYYFDDDNHFNINYTKPVNVLSAVWQVYHGTLSPYNISLPTQCFNAYSDTLMVRFYSTALGVSYPECNNGTAWVQIGSADNTMGASATFDADITHLYDGVWNDAGCYADFPPSGTICQATSDRGGAIHEDAMIWTIYVPYSSSEAVRTGCAGTRDIAFAGFGLITVSLICLGAFGIINIFNGEADMLSFIFVAVSIIGTTIVLFVGYVVIGAIETGVCG